MSETVAEAPEPLPPCPWIDAYKPGIDMASVRENLKLTPAERLRNLEAAVKDLDRLRTAAEAAGLGRGPDADSR